MLILYFHLIGSPLIGWILSHDKVIDETDCVVTLNHDSLPVASSSVTPPPVMGAQDFGSWSCLIINRTGI